MKPPATIEAPMLTPRLQWYELLGCMCLVLWTSARTNWHCFLLGFYKGSLQFLQRGYSIIRALYYWGPPPTLELPGLGISLGGGGRAGKPTGGAQQPAVAYV